MSKAWAGGSTTAWRRIRAIVLARDGHRCQLQLDGCTGRATQVHHLNGKGNGDRLDQLVSACRACNMKVGDPTRTDPRPRPTTRW